ncbi:MAG: glycosyltransferase family 39 protein, partial [Anaerolineae bacterium]|nr:glycosyltransferase family 39 protein [Anaerolineae bacterium]
GLVSPDGNANIVIHTTAEQWPWHSAALAIHVARFFSVVLGLGTILTIYALARRLWPNHPHLALVAMAFVAFNPMFLFISASINNDNLITLLASLILLNLTTFASASKTRLSDFVMLGILTGLAMLTKVSGLGLLGLVGLTLLIMGFRQRPWWYTAILGNGIIGGLALAIAGWWYWRNFQLYGDWTGTEMMVSMMGARPVPPTAGQLLSEVPGLMRSFWGLFGYFSVPLPAFLYLIFNAVLLLGLAGLAVALLRPDRRAALFSPQFRRTWPILLAWLVVLVIGFVQWTMRTPATQGRLLFPALASLAIFWTVGWALLIPRRWQFVPIIALFVVAVWVPWGVIGPAYAKPTLLTELPASTQPLDETWGESIHLLAYETDIETIRPGENLPLTLFWRGDSAIDTDYTVFVHLLDENDLVIAQRNVFHGPGVYPTSQWPPGVTLVDTYILRLPRTTLAPKQARFEVGLYDHTTGVRLLNSQGSDNIRFGQVSIEPQSGDLPNPQELVFEDGIVLSGYTLDTQQAKPGDTLTLTLYWQARRIPSANYKIFVHLTGDGDQRAAQHDSEPQNGAASTSTWQPGQIIIDSHPLAIAPDALPGVYHIVVGLYHGDTGQRLRLVENDGASVQADSVTLGGVRVITE